MQVYIGIHPAGVYWITPTRVAEGGETEGATAEGCEYNCRKSYYCSIVSVPPAEICYFGELHFEQNKQCVHQDTARHVLKSAMP